MLKLILLLACCTLHAALAAPQFVTFKDGKVGVNFGGFHADAGLGGLLTGNAAHGGLSASAGTPWGPKAAAGLGGRLDGRTSGVAYAGAEANPSVGASAVLAGNAGERGFAGSEAHAGGKVTSKTVTSVHQQQQHPQREASVDSATSGPSDFDGVQKIKPPKKYSLIKHNNWSYTQKNTRNSETATATDTSSAGDAGEGRSGAAIDHDARSRNYNIDGGANGGADVRPQLDDAIATDNNAAEVIVVNRQRQRQRQKHQQRRQLREQQRERQVQVQRAHWVKPVRELRLSHAERTKMVNVTPAAAPQDTVERRQTEAQPQPKDDIAKHSPTQIPNNADTYVNANPNPNPNPNTNLNTNFNLNTELNAVHSKHLVKHVNRTPLHPPAPPIETNVHVDSGLIGGILNIPIGILRSLQESIGGLQIDKSISFQRT